jgi:hypothetical protein
MVHSVQQFKESADFSLGCIDFGLTQTQVSWLKQQRFIVEAARWDLDVPLERCNAQDYADASRPFLRRYFPGHEVYVWLDADLWLQDWDVINRYVAGAEDLGFAIACEREHGYRFQAWLLWWTAKHFVLGYGPYDGLRLLTRAHLNIGAFAMASGAPHWQHWIDCFQQAVRRCGRVAPHGQFALVQAVYARRLPACILPATCNWICDRSVPMWNSEANVFCAPYPPYTPISVMHLAGPAKAKNYWVRTISGGVQKARLTHSGAALLWNP